MRLVWSARAKDQLDRIEEYLAERNPQAAIKAMARIRARAEELCFMPRSGRKMGARRRLWVRYTPYLIFYRVVGEEIRILHVRDARRRPLV